MASVIMLRYVRVSVLATAILLISANVSRAQNQPPAALDSMNPAFPSSHWEHLRWDVPQIEKFGGGNYTKGINKLGAAGYQLLGVTSMNDNGAAGYHLFKRQPWNKPFARPQFEYIVENDSSLLERGDKNLHDGLANVERDEWELIAHTQTKNGGIGCYFFTRQVKK
ncbi:MAG: hypothetical protein K8T89_09395 [Planctomycetes bacterium]|nr:hypothetical protein [Planctomycetota bacterium]